MSNGAMMTHRLGIELSHCIAAIAPVVGTVARKAVIAAMSLLNH